MKDLVVDRMRALAGTLAVLRARVRQAVAGEVSRAVAEAVADVLAAALSGPLARRYPFSGRYGPSGAYQGGAYGRHEWDDPDDAGWDDRPGPDWAAHSSDVAPARGQTDGAGQTAVPAALAVGVSAGRWWLGRHGSPWAAAAVGLAAGGALLAGGPAARTALGVLWAVDRLLAATDALGDGARALDRP
jgi:hypothetical protein